MLQYDLKAEKGFAVIHNSGNWRTACHCYESMVNGVEALNEWGIHLDSEDLFIALFQLSFEALYNSCLFRISHRELLKDLS